MVFSGAEFPGYPAAPRAIMAGAWTPRNAGRGGMAGVVGEKATMDPMPTGGGLVTDTKLGRWDAVVAGMTPIFQNYLIRKYMIVFSPINRISRRNFP